MLGGIAALVLAVVIALGGYGRGKGAKPAGSSRAAASSAPVPSGEYLLDVSDVTDPSKLLP